MDIFQITAIAVIGTIAAIMLKNYKPELAIGVSLITGIVLMAVCVNGMSDVFIQLKAIAEKSGIDIKYFTIVVKVIAIAYVTQFASEVCRDGGQGSIAVKLETAGKIFVMILTMPILKGFLELVISILN